MKFRIDFLEKVEFVFFNRTIRDLYLTNNLKESKESGEKVLLRKQQRKMCHLKGTFICNACIFVVNSSGANISKINYIYIFINNDSSLLKFPFICLTQK